MWVLTQITIEDRSIDEIYAGLVRGVPIGLTQGSDMQGA